MVIAANDGIEMSITSKSPVIGIFDSGVGGLTVLRALMRELPDASFVYLGDTGRYPYGSKSPETLARYARECSQFLMQHKCDILVVACNTISSTVLPVVEECGVPVVGTIAPAVDLVKEAIWCRDLVVLGTKATINSGAYGTALQAAVPDMRVRSIPCPLFVPLVEEGFLDGPIVEGVISCYLGELKRDLPQALILGCTHYPLLEGAIARFFEGKVEIFDAATAVAKRVRRGVGGGELQEMTVGAGTDTGRCLEKKKSQEQPLASFYVTDGPKAFAMAAGRFLDLDGVVVALVGGKMRCREDFFETRI